MRVMPPTPHPWTDAQRDAIEHAGGGLLVSAAAGSGKTSVLAERCAHVVGDTKESCGVHELLVVTFTENAASEMRDRIAKALAKRHDEKPDNEHLARQLSLIDRASISTLHGFCARLLRQHFHLLGLDPAFRILDGDEATLLKQDLARDLFANRYDAADEAGKQFRQLIDLYGDGQDERLIEQVIAAHETLGSVVDRDAWAVRTGQLAAEVIGGRLVESTLGLEYQKGLRRELDGLLRECAAAGQFVKNLGGFDGYVAHLREMWTVVKHLITVLDQHGLDAVGEVANGIEVPKLKAVASSVPNKDAAKRRVDAVNTAIKTGGWRRLLRHTEQLWRDGMIATAPHAQALLSLIDDFGRAYTDAKGEQSALDFNDLERLTLKVLSDGAGPSPVARMYHGQFRHVMVDEFQDINEVQDAILTRLSRECLGRAGGSNLFCVGDVKQSIYRFRLADPAQFLARRDRYAADADAGRVIDLQANFRSRGPLLAAVNAVFAKLMTKESADIDYDASHELRPGKVWPAATEASFAGSPVELHLLPRSIASASDEDAGDDGGDAAELDRAQREAVLIGDRLLEIVGRRDAPPRTVIGHDGQPRPARFADCAVLLRSMRFKADTYARQLRAMGVPVHAQSSTGYFDAVEVNDVLALLRVLDNGRQDVPLAAVLRSPLVDLPDAADALATVRLASPNGAGEAATPFHEAVRLYADKDDALAERLRGVLKQLAEWRQLSRDRTVAELLWTVYEQSGYLAFCGGLPRGEQRQANLVELHDRARQFGTFRRQGLGKFLGFLEKLRGESDLGQAAVATEADDVVRIVSIHKSKGLEYPIVVVPDLGKGINTTDLNGSILLDRDLGLGLRVVDEQRQVRYPSLAWTVVQQRLRRQTLAEELRVLYVAMTRAKEHLVLVGTVEPATWDKWREQWAGHEGPMPAEAVLAARTPMDWVGPAAANLGPAVFDVTVHDAADVAEAARAQTAAPSVSPEQTARAKLEPIEPPPAMTAAAAAVVDRVGAEYPFAAMTAVEAATAVTTLARGLPPAAGTAATLVGPAFLAESTVTAVDRGAATHAVLERIDFAQTSSAAAVAAEVSRLAAAGRITDGQAAAVDVDAILWLMSTDVGLRLRSPGVRREVPIYFAQPTVDGTDAGDAVMVRGRVDAVVPDGQRWLIVDYKTDRVSGEGVAARAKEYEPQMRLYAAAVERITGRAASGWAVVFLHDRQVVQGTPASDVER